MRTWDNALNYSNSVGPLPGSLPECWQDQAQHRFSGFNLSKNERNHLGVAPGIGKCRRIHCDLVARKEEDLLKSGFRAALVTLLIFVASPAPVRAAPPVAPSDLQVGGFPGVQICITWTDNAADETSLRVERSIGTRSNYALLTTLPANTTVYTDTAVAIDTTYWYRVQACNADGCSAWSKDSYSVSSAVGSLPNLDERYMLFLINESRADPAAHGYPAYTPRPPVAYNALLNYAAHSHSQAILNSDFTIGHCYPDPPDGQPETEYRCPSERARDVGYIGGVSESLIAGDDGWTAVEGAHQAFMSSTGHRENLLDVNAKEAGMGHAYDPAKGSGWHGQYTHTFCGWNPVTLSALPSGIVVPYWGRSTTTFEFLVNFYNAGGSGPTHAHVVIDGMPHVMSLRHGTAANGSYRYTTTLPKGTHSYYFEFAYGSGQMARLPLTGAYSGPDVEVGAAVFEVPGEHPTLAQALAHARGDVIVQLAAGTFVEQTPLSIPAGVWIQGSGIDQTIVQGDGTGHVLEANVDTLIRDLTLTGGGTGYFEAAIWNTGGQVQVRNCRLTGNNVGLFTWCFSSDCGAVVTVTNSILDHNARAAIDANNDGVHRLINNTVVANGRGIILNNAASLAENNIIAHNTGDGLVGNDKSPAAQYNDVWGNGVDYSGILPGVGDQSENPSFVDENDEDYRLQIGSPCLDAGNPAIAYNDRNGGRNDLGAYGGPYALPVVLSLASAPSVAPGAFVVSWQGYAADGIQGYDVQYAVGRGGMWVDWLSDTMSTWVQFGPGDPVNVTPGGMYCFRERARDRAEHVEPYPAQADACTTVFEYVVYLPIVLRQY